LKQAEEENLLAVVLVRDHPHTILTRQQLDYVWSELMKKLEVLVDQTDIPMPRFKESGVQYGRFYLSCANVQSYMWQIQAISAISIHTGDVTEPLWL